MPPKLVYNIQTNSRIFDLNKQIKKLKKINPSPQTTFGEHKLEDFLEADLVIYGPKINPNLPQLRAAREKGVEVCSEFGFAYKNCNKPVIAIGGSHGRTTIAHMIGFALKKDNKKVFVGGTSDEPFCNFLFQICDFLTAGCTTTKHEFS